MTLGEATRWTLIRRAAAGAAPEQEEFALLYGPVARAFFATRWRSSPLVFEVEDAAQDVLLACLKEGGALSRADSAWPGGFRAFFRGILRKTALQVERRHARHRDIPPAVEPALDDLPADDPGLSTAFDQAFAEAMVREAVRRATRIVRQSAGGISSGGSPFSSSGFARGCRSARSRRSGARRPSGCTTSTGRPAWSSGRR
ncbi:MAG: hypothetical protein MUE73_04615 [Planctomycetes bacterium]|jgi:RNA polymerase sigma-70 factor (ECF subfamily)|nr:hypothetical protein [Planctomycetota bacterium]